jgi:hypothetical protein
VFSAMASGATLQKRSVPSEWRCSAHRSELDSAFASRSTIHSSSPLASRRCLSMAESKLERMHRQDVR